MTVIVPTILEGLAGTDDKQLANVLDGDHWYQRLGDAGVNGPDEHVGAVRLLRPPGEEWSKVSSQDGHSFWGTRPARDDPSNC